VAFGLQNFTLPQTMVVFALIGALAASSMILPGISGSYILLIFGLYDVVISSLRPGTLMEDLAGSFAILVPFGIGVAIGIGALSNVLKVVLVRWERPAHAALLGLLLGSVLGLWPFRDAVHPELVTREGVQAVELLVQGETPEAIVAETGVEWSAARATELRAARLGVEGKVYKDFEYKFETDFANDEATVKDAYVEWDAEDFPVYLRVGQFKTPNSLEEQTSSRFITFMERAAITDAFDLNRRIGLGVGGDVAGFGYDLGIFGQEVGDAQNNEGYALAGRGYYDWFYGDDEDKSKLLHFGASARYRNFDNDVDDSEVRYRQRPFFHFTGTRSVDTGTIADADSDTFVGGEFAWVSGPFSLQGEAANTWTQLDGNSDLDNLWGGYVGASYFLTGEHRNYSASSGTFKRVKVLRPVQDGGHGAWEIGARLDYIDLNNKSAKGGEQYSTIAGVTWYLNDYIRMMLNGAVTKVEDAGPNSAADGSNNTIWGVGGRVQVDW